MELILFIIMIIVCGYFYAVNENISIPKGIGLYIGIFILLALIAYIMYQAGCSFSGSDYDYRP